MVEPTPWPKVPPEGAPRAVDIIADVLHAAFKGATDIDLDLLAADAIDALQGDALTVELRWYDGDGVKGEGVVVLGGSVTKGRRHTREELRDDMRRAANRSRDTADEMALMYGGCDDPLHPWNLNTPWNNWVEFVDMVCRPLTEADGDDAAEQAAMAMYRKACPHYICAALVMAANRADIGGTATCPDCGNPLRFCDCPDRQAESWDAAAGEKP